MRTPALLAFALLLCLPTGRFAAAAPGDGGVPKARPIQLDGYVVKAEWSTARVLPLGTEGTDLLVQQFRGTLMLALRSDRAWEPRSTLTLWLCPEGPEAGAEGTGAVRIDYEPYEHDRTHLIVKRKGPDGWSRVRDSAVARLIARPGTTHLELALPLRVLGLTKDKRPALRACAQWARNGTKSLSWPTGLAMRAQPGTIPADLASAKRWGTLSGWDDPSLPGAFSKTDWDAWIARDKAIRAHGAEAHQAVRLLREEWKKTKKRDKELVPQVLGNLKAIQQHERLTARDQLALATALRYLNRHERALGLLDALVNHPDETGARNAHHERALLLESMQRYEEAAADWGYLERTSRKPWSTSYARAAATARTNAAAWAKEAAARAQDEKNDKLPRVALHTTHGVIELVLYADDVPDAVQHFLDLVASKFYDGTCFHRVKGDFLAQGGDPTSRDKPCSEAGKGSSPKEIVVEQNERHTFWRGAVGFARGMRDYNGSQFFLMTGPRPKLGDYTCFGHIVRGQHVADRLELEDKLVKAVVLKR